MWTKHLVPSWTCAICQEPFLFALSKRKTWCCSGYIDKNGRWKPQRPLHCAWHPLPLFFPPSGSLSFSAHISVLVLAVVLWFLLPMLLCDMFALSICVVLCSLLLFTFRFFSTFLSLVILPLLTWVLSITLCYVLFLSLSTACDCSFLLVYEILQSKSEFPRHVFRPLCCRY